LILLEECARFDGPGDLLALLLILHQDHSDFSRPVHAANQDLFDIGRAAGPRNQDHGAGRIGGCGHAQQQLVQITRALLSAPRILVFDEPTAALGRREVFAIVGIPKDTEQEVLKGNKARIAAFVDSAYFLLFNRTLQGISEASGAVMTEVATRGARIDGSLAHAALTRGSPVETLSQPLFNPTGGYASYVVPAAFILILQQTLFLGAATVGGVAFEQGGSKGRSRRAGARAILGQALAHFCLAMPGIALYLIILPRIYGFSALGNLLDLFLMAAPFVLSVSFLAQFVSLWFTRRETAVVLFIAVSLPLFFQVGVSWPVEAIPDAIRSASRVFPSTSAIDGLVRINQMGASLHDVWRDWMNLWILTAIYGLLAVAAARLFERDDIAHAP